MKIETFKKTFLTLALKEKKTVIKEMEKTDFNKDHTRGLKKEQIEPTRKAFFSLIKWLKNNI